MTNEQLAMLVTACAAVWGAWSVAAVWLVRELSADWLPVVRAYLAARAKAQGVEMRVPDADETPGRVWLPTDGEARDESERDDA